MINNGETANCTSALTVSQILKINVFMIFNILEVICII